MRVTVGGLGPAGVDLVSGWVLERAAALDPAQVVVRTVRHPAVSALPSGVVPCDDLYDAGASMEHVYASIAERVVDVARATGEALYLVPGSPLVAECTVDLLRKRSDVDLRIIPSLSFLDLCWERLSIDPVAAGVRLVDGHRFAVEAAGERGPLLVAQCDTAHVLSEVKLSVDDGPDVVVLQRLGLPDEAVSTVAWDDLDRAVTADHLTSVFVPSLAAPISGEVARFAEVVRELRARCPWDAEQTHESLTRYMVEEAYEAVEAIASGDVERIEDELGDVLFQVVFHATLAAEAGEFTLADVAAKVTEKLVRRHPHVFAGVEVADAREVERNWEVIKRAERAERGEAAGELADPFSSLDGALPALMHAAAVGRRAVQADFDWPDIAGPLGKVEEELDELKAALASGAPASEIRSELGDLLFSVVHVARHAGVADPETALRAASTRFVDRYRTMAALAAERGVPISDALWQEAKARRGL